ncbi:MAG: ABC transporter permease [Legionella sp.]
MTLMNHCKQATINILAAKLRSFLAVLGILVGTAAVVALLSCGQLATEKALAQFKALGTDLLSVSLYDKNRSSTRLEQFPLSNWRKLAEQVRGIVKLAPFSTSYQSISFKGNTLNGSIIGADESLASIIQIDLASGYFVSFADTFEHYCVVGDSLAKQIMQRSIGSPLGKPLRIGNSIYTIIGIAKPWTQNSFFNEDINQAVIIPIAGMAIISKESSVNNAIISLKPDSSIDEIAEQIKFLINKQAPQLEILIRNAKQIIASMESQGKIFTVLLAIIGGISLLVGGIGVMNIMLVSVSERKKEIGIRKAVGAKNHEIQILFLVESIVLSLVGGTLGIILGITFTRIIAYFSEWPFSIYLLPSSAGFSISLITGVFFGFYPARRAALLEPIESLRYD